MKSLRTICISLCFLPAAGALGAGAVTEDQVVGAWRLVASEMRTPDGRTYPNPSYGPDPHGYLIYDRSHAMCVFLALAPADANAARPPSDPSRGEQRVPASYCGAWWLEPSGEAVIHDVKVGLTANMIGTQQRRRAVITGNTLYIRSPTPPGLQDYYLQFERIIDDRAANARADKPQPPGAAAQRGEEPKGNAR